VHYALNAQADISAIARCPTGAITWVEGRQFAGRARATLATELSGSTLT
jgi:hypothetical protein